MYAKTPTQIKNRSAHTHENAGTQSVYDPYQKHLVLTTNAFLE
jgi:hypothetical protein